MFSLVSKPHIRQAVGCFSRSTSLLAHARELIWLSALSRIYWQLRATMPRKARVFISLPNVSSLPKKCLFLAEQGYNYFFLSSKRTLNSYAYSGSYNLQRREYGSRKYEVMTRECATSCCLQHLVYLMWVFFISWGSCSIFMCDMRFIYCRKPRHMRRRMASSSWKRLLKLQPMWMTYFMRLVSPLSTVCWAVGSWTENL